MKVPSLKRLNSAGMAHHMVIAIIAVVVVAGFGAWRVFSSSAATPPNSTNCKSPSYAQDHMAGCLSVLGGSIIITSTGKGGDYVKTDKTSGFTESSSGKTQVNLANPNYAYVKSGYGWKICDDARLQADPCGSIKDGNYNTGKRINLCYFDIGNGGKYYACTVEDAYARKL